MIYLVSNKINPSKMSGIELLSLNESRDLISSWPVVQFDSETTGLNPHICDLTALQFGYKDFKTGEHNEIVVDKASIDPREYKEVIEKSWLIGHNLKFYLQFLYKYGIVPLNIYDTMICEQTLYLGYKPGRVSMSLGNVYKRYTGNELDKSFQKFIAYRGLSEEGIRYSAGDVTPLQDIRKAQIQVAHSRNCLKAFTVENRAVPAVAYLEWCGVHLDEKKWKEKMAKDQALLDTSLKWLNDYVVNSTKLNSEFVSTFSMPDLFSTEVAEFTPSCAVDWDSPKQVIPVFQALGFNTKTIDKEKHEEKDTVLEQEILNQKGINDEFVKHYFDYKGASKQISSYGQGHLNLINPKTGRLHTEFVQLGTKTGRMSSGGKDDERGRGKMDKDLAHYKGIPEDKVRYVNFQNIPARGEAGKETRACFTATEGNVFLSCDYSAEESRVQAVVWNEQTLLDAFENGIDTHNLYAKLCFPEELKDVDVKDVKKVRPELRDAAKAVEFSVGYGSDGSSMAKKLGKPKEECKKIVSNLLEGMTGMSAFKKKTIKFLKEHGYIILNEQTGHRAYWPEWSEWKAEEDMMDRQFWTDYKLFHKGTGDEVAKRVKQHMGKSESWFNKNVLNYPIQGGSAVVLKEAMANLFSWVVKNGYFGKILFCVAVHDELDYECPENLADMFSKVMVRIMEAAAKKYYPRLSIPAECSKGSYWIH